jgi:hypothetical protein
LDRNRYLDFPAGLAQIEVFLRLRKTRAFFEKESFVALVGVKNITISLPVRTVTTLLPSHQQPLMHAVIGNEWVLGY